MSPVSTDGISWIYSIALIQEIKYGLISQTPSKEAEHDLNV
ncbi:hypothetical protein BH23THE1_BH23THE1_10880 [soil metagenome]